MVHKRKRARPLEPSKNPNEEKNDNEETLGSRESSGYEQFREKRIKENQQRMQKMGIFDLSLKLKSDVVLPKRSSRRNLSDQTTLKPLLLPPSEPARRSSRLKSVTPVSYSELTVKMKRETSNNEEISIREGLKPEIYTEEHEKLIGDCEASWTLFVDGCGADGKRIYDPVKGETCHQCRQKTLGRHTHCSKCDLVQGQFCGDCLYMRYGENVIEANQNPSWICPVCRGICNCSLCRKAKGWVPTGALYRKVLRLGFKSVAHYLIQSRRAQLNSGDQGTEPVSANELPLIADTGSQASLHAESLDEDEGPDGSSKCQPHDDKDDGMEEEEEEVHHLESKRVDGFSKPQPEDNKDDEMEEDTDDDDNELKEEKEDTDNQDLDNFKFEISSKLYTEPASTTKPVLQSLVED